MAATVSSPWGKPGAWALDSEQHEAELQKEQLEQPSHVDSSTERLADFPSLAAASAKPKKKKSQTLSLAEFTTYGSAKPSEPTRLTHEDLLVLPTGPRERSTEELDRNRLGGGFKSYGSNRYNSNGDDSSNNSRWGSSRVSNRDSNREIAPSRADEIDNWASVKKVTPTGNGFGGGLERRERGGGGGGGFFDSQSKADEVDNWAASKSNKSAGEAPPRRFGAGFERRSSFDSLQSRDSPRDLDNWGKKKEDTGSAAGSGGVRPKLVLQPRTIPVTEEVKDVTLAKPKGANPFGEARPREEVLKEKGKDWKEIDEKLEAVKIKETVAVAEKERRGKTSFRNVRTPVERSWRKSESVEAAAAAGQPQSNEKTENGHIAEN